MEELQLHWYFTGRFWQRAQRNQPAVLCGRAFESCIQRLLLPCCAILCRRKVTELVWGRCFCDSTSLSCKQFYNLRFFSKEKCPFVDLSIFVWFYSSNRFNTADKRVLFSMTEPHAMVSFYRRKLTSLLVQAHSTAPHIENLKSTPCGQFYFNSGGPAFLLVFNQIKVLGCHCYSKGRLDLVITVVSGVVLAWLQEPKIIYSAASWTANRLL